MFLTQFLLVENLKTVLDSQLSIVEIYFNLSNFPFRFTIFL